ncbi:MAG: glutamate--tRNA ligase [Acidobacteriota bacterium]|nr:glutamate--tRNA ligase [Acidobacteriota bacterium]
MPSVRTRFAPSPTGFLHVGSARTALCNWAYARRHAGRFILRIEDTDRERSTRESEAAIVDGLTWLGIDWDEGPVRQSERRERHDAVVEELLKTGAAYRCRCTAEEIEERKRQTIAAGGKWTYDGRCRDLGLDESCGPHTVRLRLPEEGRLEWDDLVFGASGQDVREIGDRIIRRSDGYPLYHLAVVVDDLDMNISHVLRGADHHANTPFQIAIYRALDRKPPLFAHVPLIVGAGGKKLSKRSDPVSVQEYRQGGYLPEALANWLVRIGWSHGDQEIFSAEEIASLFDLESVNRASGQADPAKLLSLNLHYIKTLPRTDLIERLQPFLAAETGRRAEVTPALEALVDLLRERSRNLVEMARQARFLLLDEIPYDAKAARKHLRREIEPALQDLHDRLAGLDAWTADTLEAAFEEVRAGHGDLPMGKLAQPVRVAITGTAVSPGIFDTLALLGQRRAVGRIAEAIHFMRHG